MKNRIACAALTAGFSIASGAIGWGLRETPQIACFGILLIAVFGGFFAALSAED